MQPSGTRSQATIARHSAIISLFNGLGVLGGLALDMAVAAIFGLGRATDVFYLAFTVPQFVMLVLQGSYVSGLVPVLTRVRDRASGHSWVLFSQLLNLNAVIMSVLTLLGWFGAGWITALVGAGLEPGQRVGVGSLTRILLLMLPPLALTEVMRAQLNSLERFAVPAMSTAARHAGALAVLALGYRRWGTSALAIGYVAGALVQASILAVEVARAGGRYHFSWRFDNPDLRAAMRLMITRASGIGMRRFGLIVERFLASFLPVGSVTALSYARRVSLALYQVFANSVSTAILPTLSAAAEARDHAGLRRHLGFGYRVLSLATCPAAALMAALSPPIVWALFQRGAFDASHTALTAGLLAIYALGVPALALVQVLLTPWYAGQDAATPTRHMLGMLVVNIGLAWALMLFMGARGLALASTVTAFLSAARARWLLRHVGDLRSRGHLLKVIVASLIGGFLAWSVWTLANSRGWADNAMGSTLAAAVSGVLGAFVYLLMGRLLRLDELDRVLELVRRRADVSEPSIACE
jgi:putative peptidoglycan lipid II flippase